MTTPNRACRWAGENNWFGGGGRLAPPLTTGQTSRLINEARDAGSGCCLNRILPFSLGSGATDQDQASAADASMPGLMIQRTGPGGAAAGPWFLAIGQVTQLANGWTADLRLGRYCGIHHIDLRLCLTGQCLCALGSGQHRLDFWLVAGDGTRSNVRSEYVDVD